MVKANVTVKNAIVSGVVVGNIQATESVELTHEGRMVGDIRAPRVIIVDGASFRGRVDMGELPPGRSLPERTTPRAQLRPTVRSLPPPPPRPAAARRRTSGQPRRRRRGEEVRWHAGHRPRRDRPPHASSAPRAPRGRRRGQEEGRAEEEEVIAGTFPWAPPAR